MESLGRAYLGAIRAASFPFYLFCYRVYIYITCGSTKPLAACFSPHPMYCPRATLSTIGNTPPTFMLQSPSDALIGCNRRSASNSQGRPMFQSPPDALIGCNGICLWRENRRAYPRTAPCLAHERGERDAARHVRIVHGDDVVSHRARRIDAIASGYL